MTEMIVLDRLSKHFGPLLAVDGISLSVGRGEVLGFLGPNGAGKTTTMRMAAGFLEPTDGTARICGFDVVHQPMAVKRRLGYLPEGAPLYGEMTARAFLDFVARVRGLAGAGLRRAIDRVTDLVDLAEVIDRPIETLSKGFKRRVGLAQALLHDPEVLILDEPTDGLDPNQKHHVRQLIRTMAAGKAIIVSTHILEEVEAVCSRAVIIARGRVVADGSAEALLDRLPRHNATVVELPAAEAAAAVAALERIGARIIDREVAAGSGYVVLHVRTGDPGRQTAVVAQALHDAGITVEGLHGERGRLDDVFRDLTVGHAEDVRHG